MAVAVCAGVCPVRSPLRPISVLAVRVEVVFPRTRGCLFPGARAGGAVPDPRGAQGVCPSRGRHPLRLEFVFMPVLLTYF